MLKWIIKKSHSMCPPIFVFEKSDTSTFSDLLMPALTADNWIFILLWHHKSYSLWRTPPYTCEKIPMKKINNILLLLWITVLTPKEACKPPEHVLSIRRVRWKAFLVWWTASFNPKLSSLWSGLVIAVSPPHPSIWTLFSFAWIMNTDFFFFNLQIYCWLFPQS